MKLRTLTAAVLLLAAAGVAGWGAAAGIAAWTSGPKEPEEASAAEPSTLPRVVKTTRIVAETPFGSPAPLRQAAPVRQAAPEIPGWDRSLLNPQPTLPMQAPPQQRTDAPPPATSPAEPAPARKPDLRGTNGPVVAATPPPRKPAKPKPDTYDGRLTVAQVAEIKRRLNLTADQLEYWKPVEATLLELAKQQSRTGKKLMLSPIESQNLYFAAGPLVMRLREDQKEEARNLARAMGLETVASLI
jgi:hypothetical protein